MKFITTLCFLWTCFYTMTASAIPTIQHWETKNGARVYFVPAPDLPMVDVSVVFDAGSARDGEKFGLSNLTNALLNEGAKGLSADQIAEKFANLGAKYGADISRDMASVDLRSLSDEELLQPALELFATVLAHPDFTDKPLERTRQQMLSGLKYELQNPGDIAGKAFYKAIFGNHPYAINTNGTTETVTNLTQADVKNFHQQYYVAKNAIVAIVGAVDRKRAEQLANTVTEQLSVGMTAPNLPPVPPLESEKKSHISHPSTQTHILMGQVGMARHDPDYFTLYVGNHILGGSGLVSRLSNEVREKRGLSYGIYSYFSPLREAGPFALKVQTRNDQMAEALTVVQDTLKNFIDNSITEKELIEAKKDITGGFPLKIKSNSSIITHLAVIGFYQLPLDYLNTFNDNIESVTKDRIKEVFKRRLILDKMVIVTVGDDAKDNAIK
jgi:zinc protease